MASGVVLQRLVRARDYLHAEVARAPTLADLARQAGLSRAHFARQFAETFGVSPRQYLIKLRLEQAQRALATGVPVTDVCFDLGFASLGTFSSTFARLTGLSPRAWQRRARPFVQSLGVPRLFVPQCYFGAYVAHV